MRHPTIDPGGVERLHSSLGVVTLSSMSEKKKWATQFKKRFKTAAKGAKVCTPVPDEVTNADVKEQVGEDGGKVTRHGKIVCVVKAAD